MVYFRKQQEAFYLGAWEADISQLQHVTHYNSLTYVFDDQSFTEISEYSTEGMNVHSSVTSLFSLESRSEDSLRGNIYQRTINTLDYSFINPQCTDVYDCKKRELLQSNFDALFRKNLEILGQSDKKNANQFTLERLSTDEISLKSNFPKMILKKK